MTRRDHHAKADREHPREPSAPTDLTRQSWSYVLRKTGREFSQDGCTDLAAALTYYTVLAMFPAAIALLSLVGLVGQGRESVDEILRVLDDVGAADVADTVEPWLVELASGQGAGLALVLGLAGALWSASGYVGAFGRAMNRMYEVDEGRPVWKLRPANLLLTVVLVVLSAVTLLALVVSGPLATAIGDAVGLGDTALLVWNIAKWPALLVVVVLIVALLYWGTPNIRQPKFRWISIGAFLAIIVWILLSAAFAFYVSTFSSYASTYGSLAGVIVFLLWLWITNLALLFGAELDSELERGRELQAGLHAEQTIQLTPRDTRKIDTAAEKEAEDVRRGRAIREQHAGRVPEGSVPREHERTGAER
jgi:membrane protein